ncbi:MAG: hypothetical protein IJR51_07960, partial [Clostridia bacterium]|nr:hypothetical protein [Clostridia bacterium]
MGLLSLITVLLSFHNLKISQFTIIYKILGNVKKTFFSVRLQLSFPFACGARGRNKQKPAGETEKGAGNSACGGRGRRTRYEIKTGEKASVRRSLVFSPVKRTELYHSFFRM